MKLSNESINELKRYKKGEIIPNPDDIYQLDVIFGYKKVIISRRSVAHILQKGEVGITLVNSINSCLDDYDSVFLSDKGYNIDCRRLIILKKREDSLSSIAVVIEYIGNKESISVVTVMIADERYLIRKYKKLR